MPYFNVTVTTEVTQLVGTRIGRKSVAVFNNSTTTDAFVSQDRDGILTKGFPLRIGSSMVLTEEEGDEPHQALYAQVAAGTADIRVQTGEAR